MTMMTLWSCSDELDLRQGGETSDEDNIGQMVLFSTGNVNTTSRATIPYMEDGGRFVCSMYFHAGANDTDATDYDVTDESAHNTAWLKVFDVHVTSATETSPYDYQGNSVYWNNQYQDIDETAKEKEAYTKYGFDPDAPTFYWKNRLNHVFVGYADYNKLKTNTYNLADGKVTEGSLFAYPEYNGEKETNTNIISWPAVCYRKLKIEMVEKPNPDYTDAMREAWEAEHPGETDPSATISVPEIKSGLEETTEYPATLGLHFPLMNEYDQGYHDYYAAKDIPQAKIIATRTELLKMVAASESLTAEEKTALTTDLQRTDFTDEDKTTEGTFRNARWWVSCMETELDKGDSDPIDLTPGSVVVYYEREKKNTVTHTETSPANTFDLTRKDGMTSIADQCDPILAVTKMKPTGATQEANRVRLYFEHQLSQIQVNLTKAEGITGDILPENIVSVELLGVTKKAYVFTHPSKTGERIATEYDIVDIKSYTKEQIADNPHGTSFNMFVTTSNQPGVIKAFNAIAFGELQAIRITWNEQQTTTETYTEETAATENAKHLVADENGKKPDEDGYVTTYEPGYTAVAAGDRLLPVCHKATFNVDKDGQGRDLKLLQSGKRYIYDMELRRGVLAVIRANIEGWLVDDNLQFGTEGTISHNP